MKQNKLLLLLVLLIQASCTKQTAEPLITRWEKNIEESTTLERALASAPEGQCLKDLFSVETLKKEVLELEKKYAQGEKVRGQWRHIDLETLPIPQANFLKIYGDQIGDLKNPESIDYSSCEDLPCVFNKIYGKEEDVAGHVHYLWYLRFGNMLSLDNKVPMQNSESPGIYDGKTKALGEYLFNKKELYALWRLSLMLKAPHTNLNYLKEVQRVPRGENFEAKEYKNSCGLAYSTGWILLSDDCLTVSENQDQGYLYQAVTHELSHQVDYQEGRGTRNFYRSHKQDYLDIAGMSLNEYVDENGATVREWVQRPGIKLISPYAGKTPQENFAESLAIFRVDGDRAKENVTPQHYLFVSKDYFQNRFFEKEVLMKNWIQEYSSEIDQSSWKGLISCSKESKNLNSPAVQNCLDKKSQEISDIFRGKVKLYQVEGCSTLNDRSVTGKWDFHMKDHLKKAFNQHLQNFQKDKEYLAKLQQSEKALSSIRTAKNAYINCYKERDEEECYKEEVLRNAAFSTTEMANAYLSFHPFHEIQHQTKKSYETFVSSKQELVRQEALNLWKGCLNISHNDVEAPSGTSFIPGGYLVSSFYNCLNANISSSINDVIEGFVVEGFKVEHEKEKLLLSEEVKPHLIKTLAQKYSIDRSNEVSRSIDLIAEDKGQIRKKLLSNFDWVKNPLNQEVLMTDCKRSAYDIISFMPLFHLKKELFSDYLEKSSCYNLQETTEFKSWLTRSKTKFQEVVKITLEESLTKMAVARAKECVTRYTNRSIFDKIFYQRQRETCLLDDWPRMERAVLSSALTGTPPNDFRKTSELLQSKLDESRSRLQSKIMQEYFD